jgi:hypothetical protein
MQNQWVCFIDIQNPSYLFGEISKLAQRAYDPVKVQSTDWDYGDNARYAFTTGQRIIGNVFANGVSIPGDSYNIDNAGANGNSSYGFIRGPISTNRAPFTPLEMTFKETNISFAEICRAWAIIASYRGLIASEAKSIKANISVYFLSQVDRITEPVITKIYTYYDCVPTVINAEAFDYGADRLVERNISWTYGHYSVNNKIDRLDINRTNASTPLQVPPSNF